MVILDVLLSSLTQGAVYVISALGIVLIYKTTRVMNFAHGYIAALGGYTAYAIVVGQGQPFLVGVLVAALVGAAIGGLTERLVISPLAGRSHLELVIITVGVGFVLQAIVEGVWGYEEYAIPEPLADYSVTIAGLRLGLYSVLLTVIGIATVAAIAAVLRYTTLGLRLRATFDDPVAARLSGIKITMVRSAAWTVGGALGGASGALLAPIIFLSPGRMLLILILSFIGAVIGGLTSLPGTIIGGLGAAALFQAGSAFVSTNFASVFLYGGMIVLLWLKPHGVLGDGADNIEAKPEGEKDRGLARWLTARRRKRAESVHTARRAPRIVLHAAVGLIVAVVLPWLMGANSVTLGTLIATFIAVLGVTFAMTYSAQIVFGQIAFMMLGAYTTANVMGGDPDRWIIGILGATLLTFIVTFLIGLRTSQLHGAYFAIATLAFALIAIELAFQWTEFTGGYSGIAAPRPLGLTGNRWYALIAGIALACYYGLIAFRSSRLGRNLVAARDSSDGARALGISPERWRLVTFLVAGTFGGIAGSIYVLNVGYIGALTLDFHYSMMIFVAAVLAKSLAGSFLGAAAVVFLPIWLRGSQSVSLTAFGLILILAIFVLPRDLSHLDVVRLRSPNMSARRPDSIEWVDPSAGIVEEASHG